MADQIKIGSTRQLFIDDYLIESMSDVELQFHRPTRHIDNPVIQPDKTWEQAGGGVYLFGGTVLFDEEEDIFKMWYRTSSSLETGEEGKGNKEPDGVYKACYAISNDGVQWEKPNLGLRDFEGSTNNNMLPPAIGNARQVRRPNLIKDYADPNPKRRYKMVYMDNINNRWALAKGYSEDGIRWEMNVGKPTFFEKPIAPNGILFGWDNKRKEYVHYHRKTMPSPADIDGRSVRNKVAVMRTSSPDFEEWGQSTEVLKRNPSDPPRWSPSHGIDLAGILYTDDLYIGFVDSVTSYYVEDVPEELWESVYSSSFAEYRTEMVFSRDGLSWERMSPLWEFMRPGLWGTWDRDHIGLSKPIIKDNEIYFYYSGSNLPMGSNGPHHPLFKLNGTTQDGQWMGHAIGLAKMRLDGFVSVDSYSSSGILTTKPFFFSGNCIKMNVRAPRYPFSGKINGSNPYGEIKVEILDKHGYVIDGYSVKDSDPFTGDEVSHIATWQGNPSINNIGDRPIKLKFYLKNASVFSFQFADIDKNQELTNIYCPGCREKD